ncbi:MAG: glycoside hydrolase family 5 protein, partial [Alloacidobacterium sp.]
MIKRSIAWLSVLLLISPVVLAQRGFVHIKGPDLVDASDQPLMLRGTNLGNWLEPEGYMFHFEGNPQSTTEIETLTKELIGPEKSEAFWKQWRESYITEADID